MNSTKWIPQINIILQITPIIVETFRASVSYTFNECWRIRFRICNFRWPFKDRNKMILLLNYTCWLHYPCYQGSTGSLVRIISCNIVCLTLRGWNYSQSRSLLVSIILEPHPRTGINFIRLLQQTPAYTARYLNSFLFIVATNVVNDCWIIHLNPL